MIDLAKSNILVTGGTGFAGSHLVERLLELNANVVVCDILQDRRSYFFRKGLDAKSLVIDLDVNDFDKLHDVTTKLEIDIIFHLAAQAIVDTAYENPKQTLLTNIAGTINVLETSRLSPRTKAVVVASSDKAYGKLDKDKYVESDPLRGDHPYDVSKSAADLISLSYFESYNVPVTVTRFGNIYGEGDPNGSRIIPSILGAIKNKETLELRSDGSHIRDYLYVKDVAEGYIELAKNIEKSAGQAFNFGSEETYTVLELVGEVEKALDVKIDFKILNKSRNEIPYQSLDYSKITKLVGWKPRYKLSDTIKGLAEYAEAL